MAKPKIIESNDSKITIDGEVLEVFDVTGLGWGDGVVVDTDGGEYIVFEDEEAAGQAARDYWEELAETDPTEFATLVGEETLIQWGLGRSAGPGSSKVSSLQEWLDLWLQNPQEEWASYDGKEQDVEAITSELEEEIGYVPSVAYRRN